MHRDSRNARKGESLCCDIVCACARCQTRRRGGNESVWLGERAVCSGWVWATARVSRDAGSADHTSSPLSMAVIEQARERGGGEGRNRKGVRGWTRCVVQRFLPSRVRRLPRVSHPKSRRHLPYLDYIRVQSARPRRIGQDSSPAAAQNCTRFRPRARPPRRRHHAHLRLKTIQPSNTRTPSSIQSNFTRLRATAVHPRRRGE